MNRKKSCCIVIPIYKEHLDNFEEVSLRQVITVLGNYPIVFIAPSSMNAERYLSFFEGKETPTIQFFEEHFFLDLLTYSQLLIQEQFYQRFKKYQFMLIYQLDAYVFRNELSDWCNKGYDYIGAPWVAIDKVGNTNLTEVGNGGFSLRNVRSAIRLLKRLRYLEVLDRYQNLNLKGLLPRIPKLLFELYKSRSSPSFFENTFVGHEDGFWSKHAIGRTEHYANHPTLKLLNFSFMDTIYKVAPVQDALKFAFEVQPRTLFKMNKEVLPFGCHAWQKYDHDFWKKFIPQ